MFNSRFFFLEPVLINKMNAKICRPFPTSFTYRRFKLRFQINYEAKDI